MGGVTRKQALAACETLNRLEYLGRTTWAVRYFRALGREVVVNTGDPTTISWDRAVAVAGRLEDDERTFKEALRRLKRYGRSSTSAEDARFAEAAQAFAAEWSRRADARGRERKEGEEDFLCAFAVEEAHDDATLGRYVRMRPCLARELLETEAAVREEAAEPAPTGPVDDPGLAEAWEEFKAAATPGPGTPAAARQEMPLGEAAALVCGCIAELGRLQRTLLEACGKPSDPPPLAFRYRNYKGEVADRRAIPRGVRFAASEHHPEPQWLLDAYCLDREAERSFALKDVLAVAGTDGEVPPAFRFPDSADEVRKLLGRSGVLAASPLEARPTFIDGHAAVVGPDDGPAE